jgi:short-subunit dehydrogenase
MTAMARLATHRGKKDVIVVTGATSGIGRAIALEFHCHGHAVYATGRNGAALDALAAEGLRTTVLDVTNPNDIAGFAARLAADRAGVRVLVNNAGYGQMGPLAELPLDDVRRQFEVNTFAPLALVQALLPMLIDNGDGRVVNVSSVSGVLATPFAGAYCGSKFALNELSDALRMELAPFGIRVITVRPGHVSSSFGATATAEAGRDCTGSRYAAISDAIAERAGASQQHATPATEFARRVADHVLAPRPRSVVTLGRGGHGLVALQRLVPVRHRDRLLSRKFRLNRLMRRPSPVQRVEGR